MLTKYPHHGMYLADFNGYNSKYNCIGNLDFLTSRLSASFVFYSPDVQHIGLGKKEKREILTAPASNVRATSSLHFSHDRRPVTVLLSASTVAVNKVRCVWASVK